jgi:hypothetical protein
MTSLQPSLGWAGPAPVDILVTNRTGSAVAIGDVEILDHCRLDAASTTNAPGATTAGLANIVVPTYDITTDTLTLVCAISGVVQQIAADDGPPIRFRLQGYCDNVAVDGTIVLRTSVCGIGDGTEAAVVLTPYVIDGNAGSAISRKIVFIPLTARTGAGLTDGWFNGISGFGSILSVTDIT